MFFIHAIFDFEQTNILNVYDYSRHEATLRNSFFLQSMMVSFRFASSAKHIFTQIRFEP